MQKRREERLRRMRDRQTQEQRFSYKRAYEIPEDVPRYQIKDGENRLDIIPYKISNPLNPAVAIHGFEVGELDYFQQLEVHQSVGVRNNQYLCAKRMFSKPCFICEMQIDLYDQNEREEAKALYPKQRAVYNVIDLDEPEKGIQVWEVSYFWVENELRKLAAAKSKRGPAIVFGDYEIGKTITFIAAEEKPWGMKPGNFNFEDREPYDASICDKAYPLDQYYVMPDYEEVQKDYLQVTSEIDEEPAPAPRRERGRVINDVEKIEPEPEKKSFEDYADEGEKFLEDNPTLEPEPEAEKPRRRRREQTNKCPYGHRFGNDFDKHDDCTECSDDTYDKCGDEYDALSF